MQYKQFFYKESYSNEIFYYIYFLSEKKMNKEIHFYEYR
jgi:hypothetical protein